MADLRIGGAEGLFVSLNGPAMSLKRARTSLRLRLRDSIGIAQQILRFLAAFTSLRTAACAETRPAARMMVLAFSRNTFSVNHL